MANSEVLDLIIASTVDTIHYMLPILAFLSGVMLLLSWLTHITINSVKKW